MLADLSVANALLIQSGQGDGSRGGNFLKIYRGQSVFPSINIRRAHQEVNVLFG